MTTITCIQALARAISTETPITEGLAQRVACRLRGMGFEVRQSTPPAIDWAFLIDDIAPLDLPIRAILAFKRDGINTVADLVVLKKSQILRMPNFGLKTLRSVELLLLEHGLYLGMDFDLVKEHTERIIPAIRPLPA